MNTLSNTAIIPISLPVRLAKDLDYVAKNETMTRSEFVRNLIRREVAFLQLRELQTSVTRNAHAVGIRTLDDAVGAVRAIRTQKNRRR